MSEPLLNEIRATRPEAPSALRERVRALRVEEPVREPLLDRFRYTWGWRRLVLVAPATVLVALVSAGAIGLTRDDEQSASDTPALAGEMFGQDEAAPEAASPPSTRASLAPTAKDSSAAGGTVA